MPGASPIFFFLCSFLAARDRHSSLTLHEELPEQAATLVYRSLCTSDTKSAHMTITWLYMLTWPSHDFTCSHDHHMTITWAYMLTWPSHDLTCSHDHHMTLYPHKAFASLHCSRSHSLHIHLIPTQTCDAQTLRTYTNSRGKLSCVLHMKVFNFANQITINFCCLLFWVCLHNC